MGNHKTRLGKPEIPRRKPGDPFDWDLLDMLLQFKPSLADTATLMKCSEDTLEIFIKKKYKVTFSEYRDKRMASVRMTLVQKAIEMARNGDRVMLIFCLKNLCGWTDNPAEIKQMKEVVDRLVIQYTETIREKEKIKEELNVNLSS